MLYTILQCFIDPHIIPTVQIYVGYPFLEEVKAVVTKRDIEYINLIQNRFVIDYDPELISYMDYLNNVHRKFTMESILLIKNKLTNKQCAIDTFIEYRLKHDGTKFKFENCNNFSIRALEEGIVNQVTRYVPLIPATFEIKSRQ